MFKFFYYVGEMPVLRLSLHLETCVYILQKKMRWDHGSEDSCNNFLGDGERL